jgi:hypothetical protein
VQTPKLDKNIRNIVHPGNMVISNLEKSTIEK